MDTLGKKLVNLKSDKWGSNQRWQSMNEERAILYFEKTSARPIICSLIEILFSYDTPYQNL